MRRKLHVENSDWNAIAEFAYAPYMCKLHYRR